jgi:hypothetical protein
MKKNITLLSSLLFLLTNTNYAQTLDGGNYKFLGDTYRQWYFKQSISPRKMSAETVVRKTYYLKGDANNDGIPDYGKNWYFRLNTYNPSSDLLLLTATGGKTNGHNSYVGSEIFIYEQFYNTFNIFVNNQTFDIIDRNVFYRQSKVIPAYTSVRSMESAPILLQAPDNYNEIPSRSCIIQIKYLVRVAKRKGTESGSGKMADYPFWQTSGFEGLTKNDKSYVLAVGYKLSYVKSPETVETNQILWGNEYTHSTAILEIELKW